MYNIFITNNYFLFKILNVLIFIRVKRFFTFLFKIKEIRTVFKVVFKLLKFLVDLLIILLMIYFIFSTFAISMFGGNITKDLNDYYEVKFGNPLEDYNLYNNFNDYVGSFLALDFIRNTGWMDTMLINLTRSEDSFVNIYFFVIFFLLMGLCLFPIITGFILDNIFAYMGEVLNKNNKNLNYYENILKINNKFN